MIKASDYIGTVICNTLRTKDLIPAFCDELESLVKAWGGEPYQPMRHHLAEEIEGRIAAIRRCLPLPEGSGYWDAPYECNDDLDFLFEALNDWAPDGLTFGAHPGDGADFGYWPADVY